MSDGLERDPSFDERIRVMREQRKKISEARKAVREAEAAMPKHGEESDIESERSLGSAGSEKAEAPNISSMTGGEENLDSSRAHGLENLMSKPIASDEKDEVTPRDDQAQGSRRIIDGEGENLQMPLNRRKTEEDKLKV